MTYGTFFLLSLILTVFTESIVLQVITYQVLKLNTEKREVFNWGLIVNFFSFPYLWFVLPLFISARYYILIGEAIVVLIETILLMYGLKLTSKNALILSIAMNVVSYVIGNLVFRYM